MNGARRRSIGFFAAMAVTSLAGLGIQGRRGDNAAPGLSLHDVIPEGFADWRTDAVAAAFVRAPGELEKQLYQQLLERTYIDRDGRRIMLSMAYGIDQSAGLELHWPELCYRFGGYTVHGKHLAPIRTAGSEVDVSRLIAELPQRPEPVTYWAVLGGERIPDAQTFRLRRLAHAVQREAADGLLVRVSSIDPLPERAFALQARFIDDMVAALAPGDRPKIVGVPTKG